jgi:hypothetical protein
VHRTPHLAAPITGRGASRTPRLARSPVVPAAASAAYLAVVLLGPRLMRDHKPFALRGFMVWYNLYQVVANALIVGLATYEIVGRARPSVWWLPLDLSPRQHGLAMVIFAHYTDKYTEFLDSLVMVLRKKEEQVCVVAAAASPPRRVGALHTRVNSAAPRVSRSCRSCTATTT